LCTYIIFIHSLVPYICIALPNKSRAKFRLNSEINFNNITSFFWHQDCCTNTHKNTNEILCIKEASREYVTTSTGLTWSNNFRNNSSSTSEGAVEDPTRYQNRYEYISVVLGSSIRRFNPKFLTRIFSFWQTHLVGLNILYEFQINVV